MTQSEFATLLDKIQEQERAVREAGQKEYAHDEDNCHANFDRLAKMLDLSREQVLMVYAVKHWDGIVSWVKGHTSQREDVRGRIKDLRLYLALLWGMVEDKEESNLISHAVCCGCICHVCNGGHNKNPGSHTTACVNQFNSL